MDESCLTVRGPAWMPVCVVGLSLFLAAPGHTAIADDAEFLPSAGRPVPKNRAVGWAALALLVLASSLVSGCWLSFQSAAPFPDNPALTDRPYDHSSFSFSVIRTGRYTKADPEIEKLFEDYFARSGRFRKVIYSEEKTTGGLYCLIEIDTANVRGPSDSLFGWLTAMSLWIIPYYQNDNVTVNYYLYSDGKPVRKSAYNIDRETVFSIILFPAFVYELAIYKGDALKGKYREQLLKTADMFFTSVFSDS